MKRMGAGLIVMLFAMAGCNESTPGGAGVGQPPSTAHKPIIGQSEDTFTLGMPVLATSLKQGESKVISISINRGTNFDEDITLKFSDLPKGLTIDPAAPLLKHGDKETKITVATAADAALGDFTVKVTGHPTKGADAASDLKIKIDQK